MGIGAWFKLMKYGRIHSPKSMCKWREQEGALGRLQPCPSFFQIDHPHVGKLISHIVVPYTVDYIDQTNLFQSISIPNFDWSKRVKTPFEHGICFGVVQLSHLLTHATCPQAAQPWFSTTKNSPIGSPEGLKINLRCWSIESWDIFFQGLLRFLQAFPGLSEENPTRNLAQRSEQRSTRHQ